MAELLIALVILGVIATFTIPKVLSSQQSNQWKSQAKEVASMISGAYSVYQSENSASASTTTADLSPYMNYISVDTSTTIDYVTGAGTFNCSAAFPCLKTHSGGSLVVTSMGSFGGTSATDCLNMLYDPDGISLGNEDSIIFMLCFNGRIASLGDPAWFSWD